MVAATHALYKERIYTLNDYITVKKWVSNKGMNLAKELKCMRAFKKVLYINRLVERRKAILSYKSSLSVWLELWIDKDHSG